MPFLIAFFQARRYNKKESFTSVFLKISKVKSGMISGTIKILLVEDNPGDVAFTRALLKPSTTKKKKRGFELDYCQTLDETVAYLSSNYVDIVLLDLNLPDSWGLDTFHSLHQSFPDVPIIILTGIEDENVSLHAIQDGAQDYLIKGEFDRESLIESISFALEEISY
ncbi:response regulator [Fibrobacterota bacterium]